MSIFDIFTFKKEATRIFSKENFVTILLAIRNKIIDLIKENISGAEKKELLDNFIVGKITALIVEHEIKNKVVLWMVSQVVEAIPSITQIEYNFLKEKIKNL